MPQDLMLGFDGLVTSRNPHSKAGNGLLQAQNVIFDVDGSVMPRGGFQFIGKLNNGQNILRCVPFQEKYVVQLQSSDSANTLGWLTVTEVHSAPADSTALIQEIDVQHVGTLHNPTWPVSAFVTANNGCLYFTSTDGIYRLDEVAAGTPRLAGVARPLDMETLDDTESGGTVDADSQVAYRGIIGYRDANNNLILSAPSQRHIVVNASAGSIDPKVRMYFVGGEADTYFFQIYRSINSGGQAIPASDDMSLAYEVTLTATDIANGYVEFTDRQPDELLGATAYFSSLQDGILQSNDEPPLAADIAQYNGYVFFADTRIKQRLFLTLLAGQDSDFGWQNGEVLTIGSHSFTGSWTPGSTDADTVEIVGGSGSLAADVDATARNLVRSINAQAAISGDFVAYYVSGYAEAPGRILIESISPTASEYSVSFSGSTPIWSPALYGPVPVSTSADDFANGLYWSKKNQPDAVPSTNYVRIGSRSAEISRIVAVRDALLVFKGDGLWRVSGEAPFTVEQVDPSLSLPDYCARSVAVVNNQVVYITPERAVNTVSDYGSKTISDVVSFDIGAISPREISAAVASCDHVGLTVIASPGSTGALMCVDERVRWSKWTLPDAVTLTSIDSVAGKLVMGGYYDKPGETGDREYVLWRYVPPFRNLSCADDGRQVTVSSVDTVNNTLTFSADLCGPAVGDFISGTSATIGARVASVVSSTVLGVEFTTTPFVAGSTCRHHRGYPIVIQPNPRSLGNPHALKQWSEVSLCFGLKAFASATLDFQTDLSTSDSDPDTVTGEFTVDQQSDDNHWGYETGRLLLQPFRTYVPMDYQVASQMQWRLSHRQARAMFILDSAALTFTPGSEENTR